MFLSNEYFKHGALTIPWSNVSAIEEVDSCPLLGVGQPAFSLVVHLRTPVKEETSIEVLRANDPEERRFALVEMLRALSGRIPVRMVDPSARPWLEISED